MNRLLPLVLLPPVLAVEVVRAYLDALRRNSGVFPLTLVPVTRDDDAEMLPVCSCCRMRALRPAGPGRVCPDCDRGDERCADMPERHPPTDGTNRGV